jgi:ornithine cyclodeaminase/alanine dehydrogenase-like protein (mu-crystallin family)
VVRVLDSADVGCLVSMAEAITAVPEAFAGWLARDAHVTAVGSVMPHQQELDPRIRVAAGKYVPDSIDAAVNSAELRHTLEARLLEAGSVYGEPTAVAAGRVADLTGLGIQDAAVAALAARRASEHGASRVVPLGDW